MIFKYAIFWGDMLVLQEGIPTYPFSGAVNLAWGTG